MKKRVIDAPIAFAFECDFGLCRWAQPSRQELITRPDGGPKPRPSPESKPVQVRLIKERVYRQLINRRGGA